MKNTYTLLLILILLKCDFTFAQDYLLNGVVFNRIETQAIPQERWPSLLWGLEVEEPISTYSELVSNQRPARISVVTLSPLPSKFWMRMWQRRVSAVHVDNHELINDHADNFFKVIELMPVFFKPGDIFALERRDEGNTTYVTLNGEHVGTIDQPGHFDFWARAWYTGDIMPAEYQGSLMKAGDISENLLNAYTNRAKPIYTYYEDVDTDKPPL